jgi:hypothetical protein
MLGPLATLLTTLLTQALTLVPIVVGFALFIGGAVMALGNHQRGKEGIICALVGGAVMLTSMSIGAAVHA